MQRRSLLKLGIASAAVLAVAGGTLALLQPGLHQGRLSPGARDVFRAVGGAILDGSLPNAAPARVQALDAMTERIDALAQSLPPHAQAELSQLLALLASSAGRVALAGLTQPWSVASVTDLQQALESMRTSALDLRQQAYHALHDIVGGAYFSDASTWGLLGYPGPRVI